ncbi:MAG: InlB B-repeat-containing protein [Clostridiales Family XIII bacterium]|jgi:uncharacterized repeat protein (TIGR02543 family)|nr:InlB B-repeat-containing protein [Clostridiales Family XIII bacterium]
MKKIFSIIAGLALVCVLLMTSVISDEVNAYGAKPAGKSTVVTITFNASGGTLVKSKQTKKVTRGKSYGALPTPTRSGYVFRGWYTKKTAGTLISAQRVVKTALSKKTLYAHWEKCYKITFDANGGTTPVKSKEILYMATYGNLPVPTRAEYYFMGWYTQKTGGTLLTSTTTYKQKKNRTVYAHWGKQTKIACVGASITYGSGLSSRSKTCYPAQLQELLGETYLVKNFGIKGTTIGRPSSAPYTDTSQFADAIDFKPDIVIILMGTNDAQPRNWKDSAQFESDYHDIFTFFSLLPSTAKVYTASLPDIIGGPGAGFNLTALSEINGVISAYNTAQGIPIIDVASAIAGNQYYYQGDGIHMNEYGAEMIARTAYDILINVAQ